MSGITYYGLRHRSLTELALKIGVEGARMVAGHDVLSRILERHYLHLMDTLDLTALALGEETDPNGHSKDLEYHNHEVSILKMDASAMTRTNGAVLEAYVAKLAAEDQVSSTSNNYISLQ